MLFIRLSPSSSFPSYYGTEPSNPTRLEHIVFGLGGSAKTWNNRRDYTLLWWVPNATRGFVWLDKDPPLQPADNTIYPPYRVSARTGRVKETSDRLARILKESFELGLPDVKWFIMGDDDTIFFVDNLVSVLSRYDHRQMYYIGGNSEGLEQNMLHGFQTAFGGGGYAVSYPLAAELVRVLDGCIERYHHFWGCDEKVAACVAELGVPLTVHPGFHQFDLRGDPYGFLAAHPVAPLVSLHHLDYVNPLFPARTQMDSLKRLLQAYHIDPGLTVQQSFCYDQSRNWSVSVSWGYTAQLYPSSVPSNVISTPLRTFRTWRTDHEDGSFVFNTRRLDDDPCERPIIYFLDKIKDVGDGKTMSTYKKVSDVEKGDNCTKSAYMNAKTVEKIVVIALKTGPDQLFKAPRRQCCEITNRLNLKSDLKVKIRSCKPGETMSI